MKAELCPQCGSNKIEQDILGTRADCAACGWDGKPSELAAAKVDTNALSIATQVSAQYLLHLSQKASPEIAKAMIVAGVVGGKEPKEVLARIIRAATMGAHSATLTEIDAIQKEGRDVTIV
jgi:hypothetical protein